MWIYNEHHRLFTTEISDKPVGMDHNIDRTYFFEVILINMYWWRHHDLVWWSKVALAFNSGFPLFLLILWISFVFLKTLILLPKLLPLDGSKGMLFYQDSPRCLISKSLKKRCCGRTFLLLLLLFGCLAFCLFVFNFILRQVSVNEVWSFKMYHLLDLFYRMLCQIPPRKFYPNLECLLQEETIHIGSFKTTQWIFSELEAPGFHQKADVLEKTKQIGKLIHRKKIFLSLIQFNIEVGAWNGLQI